MTFEPLKNKIWCFELETYAKNVSLPCIEAGFLINDVRSAVNGLKHDIRTKDLEADNKEDAIKKMCNLVDKWFEDVI